MQKQLQNFFISATIYSVTSSHLSD